VPSPSTGVRGRSLFWALAAAALLNAPRSAAQPDAATEMARALYEKGQRQYDLGHFEEALRLFESAYEAKPVAGLLFNIGQCHRRLGDLQNASTLYRSFLRADPDNRGADRARELLAEVEEKLRMQSSAAETPPKGLAPAAQAMPVLVEAIRGAGPAPQARARVRGPAIAAAGTAVALLAVAVAETLAARSATNQLSQLHRQEMVSAADDARLRNDAESKRARATVLYVASAVAAAAGIGFYFAF
jgi:tetratricopeptide (TPR) repeat protein